MSDVGHRHGGRPIAAALAMRMTSVFRQDGVCALRIGGRDCWFASPYNSACNALRVSDPADAAGQLRPANR
jgi:hypothetical protein